MQNSLIVLYIMIPAPPHVWGVPFGRPNGTPQYTMRRGSHDWSPTMAYSAPLKELDPLSRGSFLERTP